jgi:hypothetical protein
MKPTISRFSVLLVLMGTFLVWGASAQKPVTLTFKAPGSFVVGDTKFPAGTYTVSRDQKATDFWEISSDSKAYDTYVKTATKTMQSTPKTQSTHVIFEKYGDTLVLKEFWFGGQEKGYVVAASYAEKKAATAGKPTEVSIPAE